MKQILFTAVLSFSFCNYLDAQVVNASPETQTVCSGIGATLSATVAAPGSPGSPGSLPTTSYSISSIGFLPDTSTMVTVVSLGDDDISSALPIGFNFCFFGANYSDFYIGSNGWLSFSVQPTTPTTSSIPSTAAGVPRNCIMGPWQNWVPNPTSISYRTSGVAPNRKLVVSWTNTPLFSCASSAGSFQIVIYESSNIIENYIASKPACLTFGAGTAVQGIHNNAGTVAFVIPGRNSTPWTAISEGWRYTPNAPAAYIINWYSLPTNTLIGSGSSITVTPAVTPQYYYAQVSGPNGCGPGPVSRDTVEVLVTYLPTDAGSFVAICPDAGTTLNATGTGAVDFVWTPASGLNNSNISNPIASPSATTLYTVAASDASGCTGYDTVTVFVHPAPNADAGANTSICEGDNTTLNATGGGTYDWSPVTGLSDPTISNPVASPTTTTSYTVTVTNSVGCTDLAQVTITVNPVPVATATTTDSIICSGVSTTLMATGGTYYSWLPASWLGSPTSDITSANPQNTTTYTVTVSTAAGCSATDTVQIVVNNTLSLDVSTAVDASCGMSDGSITAGTVTGGTSPYEYSIDGVTFQSSPTFGSLPAGTYTMTVRDLEGCTTLQTIFVGINSGIIASFTANPPTGSAPLTVNFINTTTGATDYIWDFGDLVNSSFLTNPSNTYINSGLYTVTLIAYNGSITCADTATFVISVINEVLLVVPNIFTPNGDNNNDMFQVLSSGLVSLDGTIFNRWGNQIASWKGTTSNDGWDGKINGKIADDGTYFYVIVAEGIDGTTYEEKGFVQLLGK